MSICGPDLFGANSPTIGDVNEVLQRRHYLGPVSRYAAFYADDFGVAVFANPASRRLPQSAWLELSRWCITSQTPNAGSQQWAAMHRWLRRHFPQVTTVVSYSDPSVGHTGALYRACNWLWAPTWHRLRPPPSGNGQWSAAKRESVKDRWVFPLQPDAGRQALLRIEDAALVRRFGFAEYRERIGGDFKRWRQIQEAA